MIQFLAGVITGMILIPVILIMAALSGTDERPKR